ncbi:MAG: hypothetical protein HF978_11720 [Desulfobacteraceae bacterium]|nr:hypothetical protein [Desulfobacteraceae bacterium]MBC2756206.1 hypothetical protein [Desulfobacteraceae bacterium]
MGYTENGYMPDMMKSSQVVRPLKCACLLVCLLSIVISGCSAKLNKARNAFYNGQIDEASGALSSRDDVATRDQLLFYMEKGLILHHAGDYQGSIDLLLNATALMQEQEVISAGQQTASMVTSEWLTDYKGEYAERLLVHTYLMMNFLILGDHESALVEAKQALVVYDTYPEACSADYFTRALIAHCYESLNEINGAYIEYKKLAELMPDPVPVARKLCVLGNRLGFYDEVEYYQQFLPEPELNGNVDSGAGELIVFVSQGKSPVKIPHNIVLPPSIRFSFSTYENRSGYITPPAVGPVSGAGSSDIVTSDIGEVLKASLNERLVQVIAKETARVVVKEAIAHNIDDDNVETLVRIAFFLMEVPDTRCWETLPAYLTMIRVPLLPGENQIHVNGMDINAALPQIDANPGNGPFYHYSSIRNGTGPRHSKENSQSAD